MHAEVKRVKVREAAIPGVQIAAPTSDEDSSTVLESSDSNAQSTGKKRVRAKG